MVAVHPFFPKDRIPGKDDGCGKAVEKPFAVHGEEVQVIGAHHQVAAAGRTGYRHDGSP